MNTLKKVMYVDVIAQAIPLAVMLIVAIFALILWHPMVLVYYVIALLFLVGWQILSAIVLAIWQRDVWRGKYLLAVAAYFLILVVFSLLEISLLPRRTMSLFLEMMLSICIPSIIGIAYFRYSYTYLLKLLATPRSFWEL